MAFSAISVCSGCGAKNRIPAPRLADTGRCGACKLPLSPVSVPLNVNQAEFDEIVSTSRVPVLVDFWAEWCGPCRMAAPEVHQLAGEVAGQALVLKVDTEAEPRLAARFQVQSIPYFIVFRNGQPALQRAGVTARAEMRRWLAS